MRVQINGRKSVACESVADAQRIIREKVAGRVSSTGWYRGLGTMRGAAVTDAAGNVVARVSYNGRAWTDADYGTPDHREIVASEGR